MGFIDALFSTASTASTAATTSNITKVKETPKVRGAKERLSYVDVIDDGSHILLRVDSSGCETKVSFDSRPLPSDHKTLVSNTIRFKRIAKKADGVKYISRGIVPEDTVDVLSIKHEYTFYPVKDIKSATTPDPDDASIHVIKLEKVVPTYEATF